MPRAARRTRTPPWRRASRTCAGRPRCRSGRTSCRKDRVLGETGAVGDKENGTKMLHLRPAQMYTERMLPISRKTSSRTFCVARQRGSIEYKGGRWERIRTKKLSYEVKLVRWSGRTDHARHSTICCLADCLLMPSPFQGVGAVPRTPSPHCMPHTHHIPSPRKSHSCCHPANIFLEVLSLAKNPI